jgi:hypothetical protein
MDYIIGFFILASILILVLIVWIIVLIENARSEHRFRLQWIAEQSVDQMIEIYNTEEPRWSDAQHASLDIMRMMSDGVEVGWINAELVGNNLTIVILLAPKPQQELVDRAYLIRQTLTKRGVKTRVLCGGSHV